MQFFFYGNQLLDFDCYLQHRAGKFVGRAKKKSEESTTKLNARINSCPSGISSNCSSSPTLLTHNLPANTRTHDERYGKRRSIRWKCTPVLNVRSHSKVTSFVWRQEDAKNIKEISSSTLSRFFSHSHPHFYWLRHSKRFHFYLRKEQGRTYLANIVRVLGFILPILLWQNLDKHYYATTTRTD